MNRDPWAFQRWAHEQTVGHPVRKLMLTALAMMAETNTGYCFAAQEDLARYAECSRRSAVTHLQKLEDDGFILRRKRSTKWGRLPDGFLLLAPWITTWPTGEPIPSRFTEQSANLATSTSASTLSATYVAHEQPKERPSAVDSTNQHRVIKETREDLEKAARSGDVRITHNRKVAKKSDVALAAHLLDSYNSESGQKCRIIDGTGTPTEEFRRVLGAVMRYPEIEPAQWQRTLHTVLANPWWEGPPTIGVVFGPRVVGDNLSNPARGRHRTPGQAVPVVRRKREELDLG